MSSSTAGMAVADPMISKALQPSIDSVRPIVSGARAGAEQLAVARPRPPVRPPVPVADLGGRGGPTTARPRRIMRLARRSPAESSMCTAR